MDGASLSGTSLDGPSPLRVRLRPIHLPFAYHAAREKTAAAAHVRFIILPMEVQFSEDGNASSD